MRTASSRPWIADRRDASLVRPLQTGVIAPVTSMIATSCRRRIRARADTAPSLLQVGDGRHALVGDGIGHGLFQGERLAPLARRTHVTARADLVDTPVDLQIVAVGVPEFHGELTARAPASLEDDRHTVRAQPGARAEDLVGRAHLEGEMV